MPKTNVFYNAILWGFQNKVTTGYTSGEKKGKFGINEELYEKTDRNIPVQGEIDLQSSVNKKDCYGAAPYCMIYNLN